MQNRYKNVFVEAAMLFELLCLTTVTRDSKRSSSALKNVSILRELPDINPRKPIDMKLDMCDANVQKHQFLNLPAFLYCFEVITWYSSSNCAKIKLFKSKLCTFVWKGNKRCLSFTASSVNILWKLQWHVLLIGTKVHTGTWMPWDQVEFSLMD